MSTDLKPIIADHAVEALTILAEECAEVTKEITKMLRFGLHHQHPDKPLDATEYLERELGDLLAMIEILDKGRLISMRAALDARAEKRRKLLEFSNLPAEWLE